MKSAVIPRRDMSEHVNAPKTITFNNIPSIPVCLFVCLFVTLLLCYFIPMDSACTTINPLLPSLSLLLVRTLYPRPASPKKRQPIKEKTNFLLLMHIPIWDFRDELDPRFGVEAKQSKATESVPLHIEISRQWFRPWLLQSDRAELKRSYLQPADRLVKMSRQKKGCDGEAAGMLPPNAKAIRVAVVYCHGGS
ncbi:hypothetical protein GJ744_003215 [Endocarpon pusillum]|uniref:Uncharacterized protein n=1 Tax=Endocarpon pusillum TaxID=364733 RepID=A0A8H7AEN0_9EURO|nr:hypothetical protein GJ744_003215 [Endocarpon pusillum]